MKPIDIFFFTFLLMFYHLLVKLIDLKALEFPLLQLIIELIVILLILILPSYKESFMNFFSLNKQKKIDEYLKK